MKVFFQKKRTPEIEKKKRKKEDIHKNTSTRHFFKIKKDAKKAEIQEFDTTEL